ncbi:hypothetical protein SPPR111872_25115 [Sphingobacterium prati]
MAYINNSLEMLIIYALDFNKKGRYGLVIITEKNLI